MKNLLVKGGEVSSRESAWAIVSCEHAARRSPTVRVA
jgi:hypothetical protein